MGEVRRLVAVTLVLSAALSGCGSDGATADGKIELDNGQVLTAVDLAVLERAESERGQREYQRELSRLGKDDWFSAPPDDYDWEQPDIVQKECFPVKKPDIADAIARLEERAAIRLDPTEADKLLATKPLSPLNEAVLVRSFGTPNSIAIVEIREDHALVSISALGSFGGDRWPCVADLQAVPERLLFSLSIVG